MKLAVFATNPHFLNPVLPELTQYHDVKVWQQSGSSELNVANMHSLLSWCDTAFFDFCQFPFPLATHLQGINCKIVLRIHGLALIHNARYVNWKRVKLVIATWPMKLKFLQMGLSRYPPIESVPIGLNTELFKMPTDKKYNKNICTQGSVILFKKRVYTTVQTFYELLKHDPDYTLHIKGRRGGGWRAKLQKEYIIPLDELIEILHLHGKVKFSPQESIPRWAQWLQDKSIYISNSIQEGFHKSCAEAALSGLEPFVNSWLGADRYYPKKCIFRTQTELVEKILEWQKLSNEEKLKRAQDTREFVIKHGWSEKQVAIRIRELLE